MTTTVTIKAHCAYGKEVKVCITNEKDGSVREEITIRDGDEVTRVVFDDLSLEVHETTRKT